MGIILLDQNSQTSAIELETSKKNKIDNYQVFDISNFEMSQFNDFSPTNFLGVKFRNCPSPIYNCHGMTFASRRTNIDSSNEIRKILSDDEYYKIELRQTLPGDIILYITETGDIAHSGTIVANNSVDNDIPSLLIVSKWGKYKEAIHSHNNCPYNQLRNEYLRLIHKQYES